MPDRDQHSAGPASPGAAPGAGRSIRPDGDSGPWTWDVPDVPDTRLPLVLHRAHRRLEVGVSVDLRFSSSADDHRLLALVRGAGFEDVRLVTGAGGRRRVQAVRARTLADSVGPGMALLVCGVNPSLYSADAGVGYARPGNRFWPAASAAGIVTVDRDPEAALASGLGMTDFAKRATRTAAEVSRSEYEAGFARVSELVSWLAPGAVCFVGLSGWRTVVDRRAVAGVQPDRVGGRPAYLMPSTSGLNARTPLAELAGHLRSAWDLGRTP